jgi:putative spermidine/putrescine transport system substrate-binding protein
MKYTTSRRRLRAPALAATLALALTGCSAAEGSHQNSAAATATGLADFGTMDDLEAAAKSEGQLNVIALPRDWANYAEIIDLFTSRYPQIAVNEQSPDVSSAEEIQTATTNRGLDTAPDVFDLGLTVALQNTEQFAPYKVQRWNDIPDALKEPSGLFSADYGGYMSIGYDSSKFNEPHALDDLLDDDFTSAVALNGDPTQSGSAFAAVALATVQNGGDLDSFQTGIDFFSRLDSTGNFLKLDVTTATVSNGETPVVFDWDYLNTALGEGNPSWKVTILPGPGIAGYYNQAINVDAPHPAAARLWQEFLYSDEVQNLWLKGGARPARMEAMIEAGTIDADLVDTLPDAPDDIMVPSEEQSADAGTLLGSEWAGALQ